MLIPVLLGVVALVVVLLTLLIGAGLAVVCLQLRRRKTGKSCMLNIMHTFTAGLEMIVYPGWK